MEKQDKITTNFDPRNETKTKVETDLKNHFENTSDNGKQNFQNISQQYHRTWFSFSKDHYSQCLSLNQHQWFICQKRVQFQPRDTLKSHHSLIFVQSASFKDSLNNSSSGKF